MGYTEQPRDYGTFVGCIQYLGMKRGSELLELIDTLSSPLWQSELMLAMLARLDLGAVSEQMGC